MDNKKYIYIIFIGFSFLLSLSIMMIEELFFSHSAQKVALENAFEKTKERENVVKDFISRSEHNLIIVKETKFFKDFLNGKNKELFENLMLSYADLNNEFMHIRYIDKYGHEKIRVDRDTIESNPYLVDQKELQDKSQRYYFKDSKNKDFGKVWFSAIDLNIEDSKIETPHKPTIRAIIPIEKDGEFNGILVINYFMKTFIDKLTNTPLYDMILCDSSGYTLCHYDNKTSHDHTKCWGNSLEHRYNIKNDFPKEYKKILSSEVYKTDSFVSRKLDVPIHGGMYLILQLNKSFALFEHQHSKNQYIIVSILVFLLSIILTYIIVNIFKRTLLNLDKLEVLNTSLNEASKVAKIGFWEYNVLANKLKWSPGVYELFEIEDKLINIDYEKFLSYVAPEDREKLDKEFQDSVENKDDYFVTHKVITENKHIKYVEERALHYYDPEGKYIKSIGSIYDITDKYYSQKKFKDLLRNASDGIHILDKNGDLIEFSSSFADNLGYTKEEISSLNAVDWDSEFPKSTFGEKIEELMDTTKTIEAKHKRKDGSYIDVQLHMKGIELDGKNYLYVSQRDITDQKRIEKAIVSSKNELAAIFDTALEGIALLDMDTNYTKVNKKYCELLGYSEEELKNKSCLGLTHPDYIKHSKEIYEIVTKDGHYENYERYCIRKDGTKRRFRSSIVLMPDKERFLMTTIDITDLYDAMNLIKEQSVIDELTGLSNRKAYNKKLADLMAKHQRYKNTFSFIMFDIDDFKDVNDNYGHIVGDKVLKNLSDVIRSVTRANDYIFRIGGEEFVILLSETALENARVFAEKLRSSVENNVLIVDEENINVTVSIGVTEVSEHDSVDSIFKRADDNLYISKDSGKNKVTVI